MSGGWGLNDSLALANACLSAISVSFAIAGVRAIRRKNVTLHRNRMVAAAATSFAFLVLFVFRFVAFGFKPFGGGAVLHAVYMTLLLTHEPMAVINVPLVIVALMLGLRGAFSAHREVARVAWPIWIFVLVTGILIYLLIYRLPTG
jgi:putative membrane protein